MQCTLEGIHLTTDGHPAVVFFLEFIDART